MRQRPSAALGLEPFSPCFRELDAERSGVRKLEAVAIDWVIGRSSSSLCDGDGSMYSQAMVSPALMRSLGFALVESEPCPCDRQLEKS